MVDICGDLVVWEGRGNIYAADISDLSDIKVFTVCDDPAAQHDPAISGRLVVWTDERNDTGDIYGADLSDLGEYPRVRRGQGERDAGAGDDRRASCRVCRWRLLSTGIKLVCVTRNHGVLDAGLPAVGTGVMPALDGRTLVWLGNAYGPVQGLTFDWGIASSTVACATPGPDCDTIISNMRSRTPRTAIRSSSSQGLYEEKVNFAGKAVTIRSEDPNDPAVVAATILRSDGSRGGVHLP